MTCVSHQHRRSNHGGGHVRDSLPNQNHRRERSPERLGPPAKAPAAAGTARSPELGRQFAGIAKIRASAMPYTGPNSAIGWERLKVHSCKNPDDRGTDINTIRMYIGDVVVFLVLIRDSLPRNQRQISAQKTFAVFEFDASTTDEAGIYFTTESLYQATHSVRICGVMPADYSKWF